MPRISETMINELKEAQELANAGKTAEAALIINFITVRALIEIHVSFKNLEDKVNTYLEQEPLQLDPQLRKTIGHRQPRSDKTPKEPK